MPLAISIVAIALVVLAVGTLYVVRGDLVSRPAAPGVPTTMPTQAPTPAPTPTAAPTPLTQALQVPDSTPLILYDDPADPTQIDGVTWDGQTRGRIEQAADNRLGVSSNPAGTLYATGLGGGAIHDRTGRVIATWSANDKGFGGWADDGRHYCFMAHASAQPPVGGEPATLTIAAPNEAARSVARVGTAYEQSLVRVAACSVTKDRAVVVQSAGQGVFDSMYWVVQLSTGRILATRSLSINGTAMSNVFASRDAQYIAVVHSTCCQQPAVQQSTTIYSASGTQLAQLPGSVWGFSWDGSLAVGGTDRVEVIRWADGTVIWQGPAGAGLGFTFPDPADSRIALWLLHPGDPQHEDLWVVGPDGKAQTLVADARVG